MTTYRIPLAYSHTVLQYEMYDVVLCKRRSSLAEILFRFPGVELSKSQLHWLFHPFRIFENRRYPLLGTSSSKLEVSLLGRINQGGSFPFALKFEHAVLVDTCDVF